ncbi:MAG: chloramphenicol-sensitive protein RarD [Pelagibacterales bacterium]|nr:chloramphenicol-sensitive protein RarD [Pelagibacterales bacterium]
MKKETFNGILSCGIGSLWWGVIGVLYFKSVSFVSPLELTIHRTVWTAFLLLFSITMYSKWNKIIEILKNFKVTLLLILSSILIVGNWYTWIYAVTVNKLIDAAFGYYIFPILSVFFGILFLKEPQNKMKLFAISLVIIAVIYLLLDVKSTPWIGLIVALTWSSYTLIRKKIKIPTDLGLFIESAFMTPFALVAFYFIAKNGNNFFSLNDIGISFWLFLAGANTLIPLALYLYGSSLAGLGASGMIFFLAPTGQFLLGFYYFNETLDLTKLTSFIIIWIAVAIYLRDLAKDN